MVFTHCFVSVQTTLQKMLTGWALVFPSKSSSTWTEVTLDTWSRELHSMTAVSSIENCSIAIVALKADLACSLLKFILIGSITTRHLICTTHRTMMTRCTRIFNWWACFLSTRAKISRITFPWWQFKSSWTTKEARCARLAAADILISSGIRETSLRTFLWIICSNRTIMPSWAYSPSDVVCWIWNGGSFLAEITSITRTRHIRQFRNVAVMSLK